MDEARKRLIADLYRKYETPFYLYDQSVVEAQADALLQGFPDFEFLYSIKTNPFPPVAEFIFSKGIGADAASAGEVALACRAGLPMEKILYSAPGKTEADLRASMDKAVIVADSVNELRLIDRIAGEAGRRLEIGVRVNPDFSMAGPGGLSGKFGIDEEWLAGNGGLPRDLANIRVVGIHVHVRSQVLDEGALRAYYENVFRLAAACRDDWGWDLRFVNFGGGIGIPYNAGEKALDVPRLGKECAGLVGAFKRDAGVRLIVESGRFLVGAAGKYVTPVVDVKESRGKKFVIVRNGLNGFLRPAVAELLHSAPNAVLDRFSAEPLYTVRDAFAFDIVGGDGKRPAGMETATVAGNLCTAADVLAVDAALPPASVGDLLVASNAGSYAYSLTPLLFSSQVPPLQIFLGRDGALVVGGEEGACPLS